MSEEVLDSSVRNSILAKVAGLGKKAEPVKSSGVHISETVDLTSKLNETKSGKTVCTNCNHKVWSDGEDWLHSGKEHDSNCECREVKISGVNESVNKVKTTKFDSTTTKFTSDTPFDQLLEACADSHIAAIETENMVADDVRARVIKEANLSEAFKKEYRF